MAAMLYLQVFNLSWSSDGKYCATVSKDKKVRVFDPRKTTTALRVWFSFLIIALVQCIILMEFSLNVELSILSTLAFSYSFNVYPLEPP